MALFAGAQRTATVRAATEVLVARVGKGALTNLLELRPDLLDGFARYAAEKTHVIDEAREGASQVELSARGERDTVAFGERIRRILGLMARS
jgi:CRP-like cAMP-binding protein